MKNLGVVKYFIGTNICHICNVVYMIQASDIDNLLERFRLADAKYKPVPLTIGKNLKLCLI